MAADNTANTLRDDRGALYDASPRVRLDTVTLEDAGHAARYRIGEALGEGGMGEVRRCRDRRIGRDVAMKVVRPEAASEPYIRERFLREARIQGQLEHPCIVPVYELGMGPDGATFFTMKRVRGETLEAVFEGLRAGDAAVRARWSRRRLLAALSTVCGAVEYAHTRGVVHRDLKPGNVMLGDFGEVYVLDWGVARVLDGPGADPAERVHAPMPEKGRTAAGSIIGTPGYMAPEQLMAVADLDGRADVYALGAMLFETLTLQPLHRGDTVEALMASTMVPGDVTPAARAPQADVPPELDALCATAIRHDRHQRMATARALRDGIERYLDGDRDLERRRELAARHAEDARRHAAQALRGVDDARPQALREVGRALALDADNPDALRTFVGLLLEPPRKTPDEVTARLREEEDEVFTAGARAGVRAYLVWLACLGGALALGVRDKVTFALSAVLVAVSAAWSWYLGRQRDSTAAGQYSLMALTTLAVAVSSRFFGPFVLVPAALLSITLAFSLTPRRVRRFFFGVVGGAGLVVPALVEVSGLVAPSYTVIGGAITLQPRLTELPPMASYAALLAAHVVMFFVAVRLIGRIRRAFDTASQRLHVLAWQLRQIVPHEATARTVSSPPPPEACALVDALPRY